MKSKMVKLFVAFLAVMLAFSTPVLAAKPDHAGGKKEKVEKVEKAQKAEKQKEEKVKGPKKEKAFQSKKVDKIKEKLKEDRFTRHLDKIEAKVSEVSAAADEYFGVIEEEPVETTTGDSVLTEPTNEETKTTSSDEVVLEESVVETQSTEETPVSTEEEVVTDEASTEDGTVEDEEEATEEEEVEDVVDSFLGKLRSQYNYLNAVQMQLSRSGKSMDDASKTSVENRITELRQLIDSEIERIKSLQANLTDEVVESEDGINTEEPTTTEDTSETSDSTESTTEQTDTIDGSTDGTQTSDSSTI